MIYNQRDPSWSNQRLGTVNGWTLGQYGCYVSCFAMVATHFRKDVNPADMDNIFTDRGLYIDGGLCWDGMLTSVYSDIEYVGTYHCEGIPCNLDELNWSNVYEHEAIIEVDFDHDPTDGIQTHFVRFNSYDANTGVLLIDDPWYGDEVNFSDRYGDPTVTIQKIVRYSGPALPVPDESAPPTSNPTPTEPAPQDPPVIVPEVPETPAPDVSNPPVDVPTVPPVVESPVEPEPNTPIVPTPVTPPLNQPDDNITSPAKPGKIKLDMSKFLSRKFLTTVLGVVIAVGGYLSGAISAGESLTSMTVLIGLFNVIQGLIDHKTAPQK